MRHRARHVAVVAAGGLLSLSCGLFSGPDPAADPLAVFDAAWHEIDAHYAFFSYNQLDWDAARARYRPQVETAPGALPSVLCAMVAELRSHHAVLFTSPTTACGYSGTRYPGNFDRLLTEASIPSGIQVMGPGGVFRIGRVSADIGYVAVPTFGGSGWGDQFDDVLDALGPVRALVIDIRGNGGGNETIGAAIAGRLAEGAVVYQRSRFRNGPGRDDFGALVAKTLIPRGRHFGGPVALLTHRGNGSAAEDFVMMMRVIPKAFTVGDTTIGNSSNPLMRDLPNGWELWIPQSIQMTPDGFVPEGHGLPPDIPVMLLPEDTARGVDTILQRAIAELLLRL